MPSFSPEFYTTVRESKTTTTNATVKTIETVNVPPEEIYHLRVTVVGRRTGGSGGTAGDCASYVITGTYKNVSGTTSLVGATDKVANEDNTNTDADLTVSSPNVLVRVTGDTNNDYTWIARTEIVALHL